MRYFTPFFKSFWSYPKLPIFDFCRLKCPWLKKYHFEPLRKGTIFLIAINGVLNVFNGYPIILLKASSKNLPNLYKNAKWLKILSF